MIEDDTLTPGDREWLTAINFHFFMGYARHYRDLVDQGQFNKPKQFSDIREIVECEARLATFLTPWIRKAEWHVRALTVKHFCAAQGHGLGYLDYSNWTSRDESAAKGLQGNILENIRRHGEPYVANWLKNQADARGCELPRYFRSSDRELWVELTEELPLWAVVDSFTVGTLGKFLRYCGNQPAGTESVSKLVATDLGITPRNFNKSVEAFGITRNLIFHHQRLWMRPMPKSPGLANDLARRYRSYDFERTNKQAHFIALASISKFLPVQDKEEYLQGLETTIRQCDLYALGIMAPPTLRFIPSPPRT